MINDVLHGRIIAFIIKLTQKFLQRVSERQLNFLCCFQFWSHNSLFLELYAIYPPTKLRSTETSYKHI